MINKIKENIELLIIVAIGVSVAVLDVFGITNQEIVSAAILAVLAILAFSGINSRKTMTELKNVISELNVKIEGIIDRKSLVDFGIIGHFKNKPIELLSQRYKKATKSIRILHTWLESSQPIPDEIFEAASRGVKVTIILLDPASEISKKRTQELGFDFQSQRPLVLFEGVKNAIKKQSEAKKNIQLYVFDNIPPFAVYSSDDWVVLGFYWNGRGSVPSPHLELEARSDGIVQFVNETFENILEQAKLVQIE